MAFISEIHYKNVVATASGVSEYVEVTLSPAELARAADFTVATYNLDGTVAEVLPLSDYSPVLDPVTGYHVFQIPALVTDPNATTEAEAVALVDAAAVPPVLSFYDIGGGVMTITALDGPAAGSTSVNIPAATGDTLQFDAFGNRLDGPMTQDTSVICLTKGTMIRTPGGARLIEELQEGELVCTRDSGDQPLRMVLSRTLGRSELRANRSLMPVRIEEGALGFGLPERDLLVSPQHRMLFQHIRIPLLFGEDAVFVSAKSLAMINEQINVDSGVTPVTYYHLVFDQHEVIYAEGAATESFDPGEQGLAALSPDARAELYSLFPQFRCGAIPEDCGYITLRSWELMAAVA